VATAGWIWDACGLLNLVATARPAEILRALPALSHVVDRVLAQEVRYLRPLPEEDPEQRLVAVDLSPLLEPSLLREVTLSSNEESTYLAFVEEIDDGEALTCAVAQHRGFAVVTDDRAAIRLAGSVSPSLPIISTPEWVREWASATSASPQEITDVVRRISVCGKWIPRRLHPDHAWWMKHLTEG
jgi:hypothetical protein